MTRDASEGPRYRRPSRRRLMKTLRTLKAMMPPPTSGETSEDIVDFLARLVDVCQSRMETGNVGATASEDAELQQQQHNIDLAESPSSSGASLASLPCLSAAAIADMTDQLFALGAVRLS